jgi:hypothetical protein
MSAILFVPVLAFTWIIGFAVVLHAAHYFLTIVESSATGMSRNLSWDGRPFREWIRDGVSWPDEPIADWLLKALFLSYLTTLWVGPAMLIGYLVAGTSPWATVIAAAAFWILFPIGLLSAMSSEDRWTPFRLSLLGALARRPGKTLGFYLLSAPVLAVLFLTFDLMLIHSDRTTMAWALALAPVAAAMLFIYARLLGRLGLVMSYIMVDDDEPEAPAKPRKRKRRKPLHAYDERHRFGVPTEANPEDLPTTVQPADLPALESPLDGPVTGYEVDYSGKLPPEEEPKPRPVVHKFDDEDDTPITVQPAPDVTNTDRARLAAELAQPSQREIELYLREKPTEPANPYGAEAVTFLFDGKTLDPWLRITLGFMALALLQRALDALRPV